MTTYRLRSTTLKYILNLEHEESGKHIFKFYKYSTKRHVNDILTIIPRDICNIIHQYDVEEILLNCTYDVVPIRDSYQIAFPNFEIDMLHGNTELILWNNTQNIFHCYYGDVGENDGKYFHINMINKFMEQYYDKPHYLSGGEKLSDNDVIFIAKNRIFFERNTHDTIQCIKILDYKRFRELIAIIKCVYDAVQKYRKY